MPGFDPLAAEQRRRRAGLILGGVVIAVLLVVVVVLAVLLGQSSSPTSPQTPAAPTTSVPEAPPESGWDVAAQTELANKQMLAFPETAAFPHQLTTRTAGPALTLPKPTGGQGELLLTGFPAAEEGAIAQLVELTRTGLQGGDPDGYARTYESLAEPDAPNARSTFLYRDLQAVRSKASLPPTGAVPGLTFQWQPSSALIKGSTDQGRYVVACVLGELVAGQNGQSLTAGTADCQALRWTAGRWRISPGALAARAPIAWPGSAEAVQAGYRDLR